MTKKSVAFTIDGKICHAEEGQNLIDAAKQNGIYIPTLCYSQEITKPLGTCRVCIVKERGCPVAGCILKIYEGMQIEVHTPELEDARKGIIEMLFVEGNHMCPSCEKSGDCELQALAYQFSIMAPRFLYEFPNREIDYTSSKIVLERNRCILCKRCVQEIHDPQGRPVFSFENRGAKTQIKMELEGLEQLSDAMIDRTVHLCPVGALLKKGKGFDRPYGTRLYDRKPIGYES